jgi:4a-hydroxytetrahydrobiopterin dehydratase
MDETTRGNDAVEQGMSQVPNWDLVQEDGIKKIRRTFDFNNFAEALDFTNRLGEIAEEAGHHPIITLTWGRVTVTWYTHRVKGLHENDFTMAARTDELY